MPKVFKVTPKRVQRVNGVCITPEMEVIVTTRSYTSDPFYNGAVEVKEAFMKQYGVDIKKGCFNKGHFVVTVLG